MDFVCSRMIEARVKHYEMALSDVVIRLAIVKLQKKLGAEAPLSTRQIANAAGVSQCTVQRSIKRQRNVTLRLHGTRGSKYVYEVLLEP